MASSSSIPDAGANAWPLTGPRATVIDSIVSAFAVLRALMPRGPAFPASIDLVAAELPTSAPLITAARSLAETLLDDLVQPESQPSLFADSENATLGVLRDTIEQLPIKVSRAHWDDALGDAAGMIREVGLERHTRDCQFGTDPSGTHVIVSSPVLEPTAHVWLLGRLFERAEMFALRDRLLVHERMASAWYFERWSVVGKQKSSDVFDFARGIREQEWSLVERETVSLGESVITALEHDDRFDQIPPRQRRLAHALQASIADFFCVEAMQADRMTVRPARGGKALTVHEHNPGTGVRPGYILAGRLIPFDRDLWLRSPGAAMFSPADARQAELLGEAVTMGSRGLPLGITIEAILSTVVFAGRPPLSPRPVKSSREAQEILEALAEELDAVGAREEVGADALPNAVLPRNAGLDEESRYYKYTVDDALGEWMESLTAQAVAGDSSGARSVAASGGGSGGKGKKKHRGKKRRR